VKTSCLATVNVHFNSDVYVHSIAVGLETGTENNNMFPSSKQKQRIYNLK